MSARLHVAYSYSNVLLFDELWSIFMQPIQAKFRMFVVFIRFEKVKGLSQFTTHSQLNLGDFALKSISIFLLLLISQTVSQLDSHPT